MTDDTSINLMSELSYVRSIADKVYSDSGVGVAYDEPQAENVRTLADSVVRLTHIVEVMLINTR